MATSLLALLDDITTVLDDVALLAKVAAKKTTGVLGDDLALNAHQVSGVHADRELPVVWAVAKGSFKNKAILVPAALAVSALAPWAITPLLMLGGLYLCFEGFEKAAHKFLHTPEEEKEKHAALARAVADSKVDLVAFEKDKISGAVRTDFILSGEIIVITLGAASAAPFVVKAGVLSAVAVLMTVFVYGFVACIVKLDDAGLHLTRTKSAAALGRFLLLLAPALMKGLSALGTAAMFVVGGGILAHGLSLHAPHSVLQILLEGVVGVLAGALVLGGATLSASVVRRAGRR